MDGMLPNMSTGGLSATIQDKKDLQVRLKTLRERILDHTGPVSVACERRDDTEETGWYKQMQDWSNSATSLGMPRTARECQGLPGYTKNYHRMSTIANGHSAQTQVYVHFHVW